MTIIFIISLWTNSLMYGLAPAPPIPSVVRPAPTAPASPEGTACSAARSRTPSWGPTPAVSSTWRSASPPTIDFFRNKEYVGFMVTYTELRSDRKRLLALTSLTLPEFELLLPAFARAYQRLHPPDRTMTGQP